MTKYYDGNRLLQTKDLNKETPELFLCTSNRSAGKTTFFAKKLVSDFIKNKKKFGLLFRYNYEIDGCADMFFAGVQKLFYPHLRMVAVKKHRGIYAELYLGSASAETIEEMTLCGYAVTLNNADNIKKHSHEIDVDCLFFDEFQSETNHYCNEELSKFLSVHKSLARGRGEQSRYLPVYMCSNLVSLLNPYYDALNVGCRLNKDTKILRGDGWVLEVSFNESASEALSNSGIGRAFADSKYMTYATAQNVYLNDNEAFVEKMSGKNRYLVTMVYEGVEYGVYVYNGTKLYVSRSVDASCTKIVSVSVSDHAVNRTMITLFDEMVDTMRRAFEKGDCRFEDLKCKECFMHAVAYH